MRPHLWSFSIVLAQLLLLALPALGYAPPLELFGVLAFCVLGYGEREVDAEAAHPRAEKGTGRRGGEVADKPSGLRGGEGREGDVVS
ncbi:hypothetical protein CcaverHIS641_0703060 [Cutaneotrichosporon cavernicola]|nr:hypothetical protein CcaverHIS641_0703060 [Cutaneotrichosporon cavernicola]